MTAEVDVVRAVAGFMVGTVVGIAVPWILLVVRKLCMRVGFPLRMTTFCSLLAADGASLVGGYLVSQIAERFEPWIAGGSVLSGLAIVAAAYWKASVQEPGKLIRAYALGFSPPFVLFAVLGTVLGDS